MEFSPDKICKLAPNKVDYLIPGGEMINEFLGDGPEAPVCSQMWVASLVTSALRPGTTVGLSRFAGSDRFLRDCLTEDPAAWLGTAHAKRWGSDLGFLLKLLHSRDRLLIQTHPDGEKAMKYFGLPHGKDEAWYVLSARPGAYIWLGFRPGVTPQGFRALIEAQDSAGMLECLHKIEIQPGQVYFIPAGTVHALGSDCLVAEIQEPVDLTLRAEYIRPDGSRLPRESMYGAAGMDGMMDCFTFDCLSREALLRRHLSAPLPEASEPWRKKLISARQTGRFWMDELTLGPEHRLAEVSNPSFQVLLVLEGAGELRWVGGTLPVRQGEEFFVPHGVPSFRCATETGLKLLTCGVPEGEA
ncbi:MAG TPA: class I mannose-6-phosphate isomerase [Candidatus Flavonifractor merdavium]|nr:class I mannose-6-phosphate isomerase [Candidatus Flavonifractor merdavium]